MENMQLPTPQTPGQSKKTPNTLLGRCSKIIQRFRVFVERHRLATIIICSALIVFLGGTIAYMLAYQPPVAQIISDIVVQKKEDTKYYAALSGVEVSDELKVKAPVRAVMIENSPDARPQSGLKQAEVVYEAVAEGGITRFLVLYQQNKPGLIGPVRSVREYYVDWTTPYDACIAHVGGSAAALDIVRNGSYCDLDQFFNPDTYWRASDRYAPHNVYTSSENLDALVAAKGQTSSDFTGFNRTDDPASDKKPTADATDITINISSSLYNTAYTYSADLNTYTRFLAGEQHTDREEGAITPKVVIAMKVQMTAINQDGYRESIETSGSGEAVIFQNGTATTATWKKDSRRRAHLC